MQKMSSRAGKDLKMHNSNTYLVCMFDRSNMALGLPLLFFIMGSAWAGAAFPWVNNVSVATYSPSMPLPAFNPIVTRSSGPGYWCAYISNFTSGESGTINLLNRTFNIYRASIGPNYLISLWVNNQSYSGLRYNHIPLGVASGINYTLVLTNASYSPEFQNASMSLCGRSTTAYSTQNITVDAASLKGTYNVSLQHSVYLFPRLLGAYVVLTSNSTLNMPEDVHISEYAGSVSVPEYVLLGAFNVSVIPGNGIVSAITATYQCAVPAASVKPFILKNGKWSGVQQFQIDPGTCQASFSVAGDPVVGLFRFVGLPSTSISTTAQYRLVQINNYSNPYAQIKAAVSVYAVDIVGIIAIIVIIAIYMYWIKVRRELKKLGKMGRKGRGSGRSRKPKSVRRASNGHAEAGI